MKLPNAGRAVVDLRKIRDYCLNPDHPRGRHKARVFASVLGMTARNADELRDALLSAAGEAEAILTKKDQYGQRYMIDYKVSGPYGQVMVRSIWIVRNGEDFARLASCYVL